ncbi:CopL family metal-binding regulatory protein [uncultured Nevskia sp.]|uniref:CopL family metal-binding regulatory protein n=1 Tax=uncultured Nevskia sp. TaxID=228950 RepID=UPI0025DCD548|nr:CopL family metal-binding regulatory protein [uncultured Nevskia sp.]
MNRRIAISLLTVLALLWQGAVSAAMAPAMLAMASKAPVSAHQAAPMKHCHDMAGMQASATADESPAPAKPSCCAAGVHCLCASACGSAALPMPALALNLLPAPALLPAAMTSVIADAAPPHPFRPPIAASV